MEPLITPKNHPNGVGFRLLAFIFNLQKRYFQTSVVAVILASLLSVIVVSPAVADGVSWSLQTSAADNPWQSVTYGTVGGVGRFVAVANNGSSNRITTSQDGIEWNSSSANFGWQTVTFGNGVFVALNDPAGGNRVLRSTDGGASFVATLLGLGGTWQSVTYGNGVFVAVSSTGTGNRVMRSTDNGITWSLQTSAADNAWQSVTYGAVGASGLFVAVSDSGTENRVMTSPDGITWTARRSAADNAWQSVTYGNGLFVAVGASATVMTSPDGIEWTSREATDGNSWNSVTYGNGVFVAVSSNGTNRVMRSTDGLTWTSHAAAAANEWQSVAHGNGVFVAVSSSGTGNRVMRSVVSPPAFTLTSSSESRTVNTSAAGFTINSTGGAIASFAINATPPGMSFNTTTGALTGTPNTVAPATTYTVTATNDSGSATRTFSLTVTAAPVNNSASQEAAQAEAARKVKEQQELISILALIPKIGELTLSLGETTKSLYSIKCVKGKITKFVKKGSKCPKGYAKKK